MKRLQSNLIGIDEGEEVLFSDFEHNGPMWVGEGARMVEQDVTFSEPYTAPPSVSVSLSMYDVSHKSTARMDVRAENISATGFCIAFRTWGDTRIARVRVAWRAIGELAHSDNWKIE